MGANILSLNLLIMMFIVIMGIGYVSGVGNDPRDRKFNINFKLVIRQIINFKIWLQEKILF